MFYVPDNERGDSTYPSLKINIPIEAVADKYKWRAELTFGQQNRKLSKHILVKTDGQITEEPYDGKVPEIMNEEQARELLNYMMKIKDNLIVDSQ